MPNMESRRIRDLREIDFSTLNFEDLRWKYGTFQSLSTGSGRHKNYSSWIGVRTNIGEIEENVWYLAAERLIRQNGEQEILDALVQWGTEHNYLKAPAEAVRKEALHLHVNRIFDDPRWVDFVPFNRRYRPEALEHAHLVTVVNECCQKPGVVTQEQIDASDNGTVACPCCGRWSPFRVLEQAIQTESAAGQTEEAKGGMHLWSNFPLIEQAHRRLADVVVENQDFQTLIRHYDRPVTFFYCDPPYHATEGYYQNIGEDGFTERDHIRLRDALLSMEGKFLLSYNDDAFIRGLYDVPGIQIEPVTRLNNIRQRYDPNCQFSELLIANYDMAERAHATTQINLFDFQKGEFDETYVF